MKNRSNKTQLAFYRVKTANATPYALGKTGKPATRWVHLSHERLMNVVVEAVFAKRTYYVYENNQSSLVHPNRKALPAGEIFK